MDVIVYGLKLDPLTFMLSQAFQMIVCLVAGCVLATWMNNSRKGGT